MSTPTTASPNTDNIQVGKGILSFKKTGDSVYRDLGNVSALSITPDVTTLEHFSSRQGTKKKDLVIVLEQKATAKITMEEITPDNFALMVYGAVNLAAGGGPTVEIFGAASITGALKFVGTNDQGPKVTLDLYNVSFTPTGDLGFISDEFNQMEVTADVLAKGGVAPISAVGTYTASANLSNSDTITIGSKVYTFQTSLTSGDGHVFIGANLTATLANLVKAIMLTGVAGTDYGTGTVADINVTATSDATHVYLTAITGGVGGNSIATTDTATNGSFGAATLLGGVAGDVQAGKFGTAQWTNMTVSP